MEENVAATDAVFADGELDTIRGLLDGIEIVGERYDPNSEPGQSVRR